MTTNSTPKPLSQTLAGLNPEQLQTLHCQKHGDFKGQLFHIRQGKYVASRCPHCVREDKQKSFDDERKKIAMAKQLTLKRLFGNDGIPERFKGRTFANYRIQHPAQAQVLNIACQYAKQFEDRLTHGGGLIFAGKPGTGKTHLAAAIAHEVIQTGRSVLFISVIRAIRKVKACYRNTSLKTEQQAIESFVMPDLLILDEVGIQFGTDTEKLILFEILNGRYEAVRPTIFISNLTESELTTYIGARVMDRLQEGGGVSLSFDWDSYRKQVQSDLSLPKRHVPDVQWES